MRLNRFLATKKGLLIVPLIALLILAIVILAVPYVSAG
jgi:hypothetical protein